MALYYGIDLGTTNTCLAIYNTVTHDTIVVQPQNAGVLSLISSLVFYSNDNEKLVGDSAQKRSIRADEDPKHLFQNFKTHMGTEKKWMVRNEEVTPVILSALVLEKVKEFALLRNTQYNITNAVITCPAVFTPTQKNAIREAAALAGIVVNEEYGIVEEPSAAAYTFDLNQATKFIMLDLGGGTLDINLMQCEKIDGNYKYTPINNKGRNNLGGKEWDKELIQIINEKISKLPSGKRNNKDLEDLKNDSALQNDLLFEVQKKKIDLTKGVSTIYDYLSKDGSYDLSVKVTREEFENRTTC